MIRLFRDVLATNSGGPTMKPQEVKDKIEAEALKERIYEPKYGGKDHSGYNTMMFYEVNEERYECFEKGAEWAYETLSLPEIQALNQRVRELEEPLREIKEGVITGQLTGAEFNNIVTAALNPKKQST